MKFIYFLLFLPHSVFGQHVSVSSKPIIMVNYETKYKANKSSNHRVKFISSLFITENTSIFMDEMMDSSLKINVMDITPLEKAKQKELVPKRGYSFKSIIVKEIEKGELTQVSEYKSNIFFSYNEVMMDENKWSVFSDTATIAGLLSYKAETSYGGRKWIAWFSPEIPISDGPYKFSGLPGLIVKLESSDGEYEFSLNEIKKLDSSFDITELPQSKTVTKQKYKDMVQSLIDNPLDMFSGKVNVTFEGKELSEEELKNMLRKDMLNKNHIELD